MRKIRKNDVVMVLSGRDKGKKGKVLSVSPDAGKLVAENISMIKRHQKPSQKFQGGIIERPSAIPISRVALVCPRCAKKTRVGIRLLESENKKVRFCKKCKEIIDKV